MLQEVACSFLTAGFTDLLVQCVVDRGIAVSPAFAVRLQGFGWLALNP